MTLYRLLVVQKDALASGMAEAIQEGKSTNFLMMTVEDKLYDTFEVPTDISSLTEVLHHYGKAPLPSGYPYRPIATGDLILDSTGKALVVAGNNDFNDVTAKVAEFVEFPGVPALVASSDDDEEDDEEEDDEEEAEEVEEGTMQAVSTTPGQKSTDSRSLRVGEISNPRNVERGEIQSLITEAVGKMFQTQNIPLNKSHSRRAVRAFMRVGVRLAMESNTDVGSMMQTFFECVQKESKELGKKGMKAKTVVVMQIDE